MNHAFLTVDLGFGDAGKGSIVDYLTRTHNAHTVIRYNGGAQAGHRVVDLAADGITPREHVFSQFGSGTLAGAATHLSRHILLDPLAMLHEEAHLRSLGIIDAFTHTTIDRDALVITPFQRAINRLRELARGDYRHGSCGMGIGETMTDALAHGPTVLRVGDLTDLSTLRSKLTFLRRINLEKLQPFQAALPNTEPVVRELELLYSDDWQEWLLDVYAEFTAVAHIVPGTFLHNILHRPGNVVFEGAQGVLLDEWHGFHPHTTWSTTTLANADQLLNEAAYVGHVTRIGITRAYATRHGAGPFVTEEPQWATVLPDPCNGDGSWQRGFRVGPLDLVMLRYALQIVGRIDMLAVTCLDRLPAEKAIQFCPYYLTSADSYIDHLAPSPNAQDLVYQTGLTRLIADCRPILEEVANREMLIQVIERNLGVTVGIRSYGPTAENKEE